MKNDSNIRLFIILLFFLFLFPIMLDHYDTNQKVSSPINNSPAIAEYQQTTYVRELLSPSVFTIEARLFASEKNAEKPFFCSSGYGTAFIVNEKGYFVTNNHVIDPASKQTACLEGMAKTKNVPISSLFGIRFEIKYYLTDFQKNTFPVIIFKTFPEKDIAVLKFAGEDSAKKWKPAEFRSGSPSVVNGKAISIKNSLTMPLIIPDEPIMIMGTPLELPFTLVKGMLGNGVFQNGKETFIHYIAPNNSGNSGGPVISLLDFKIIGMATIVKMDNKNISEQAGAVPFWEIIKALRTIEMK